MPPVFSGALPIVFQVVPSCDQAPATEPSLFDRRRWIVVGKSVGRLALLPWPVREPLVSDQYSTKRPPVLFSVKASFV